MYQNNGGFLDSIPVVTKNLIIINLLLWLASLALPKVGIALICLRSICLGVSWKTCGALNVS